MSTAAPTSQATHRTPAGALPHILLIGLLVLVIAWLFGGSVFDHGYIYDDYLLIENNPRLVGLWDPLRHWAEPLWHFPESVSPRETGFWRPLTLQVLAGAKALSGGEPWGPHLVSLVLHILAALAAVRLALRLGASFWLAWGAGFLFALHPVQVQSVAWAASINDPLIGLLAILSLTAFIDWLDHGKRRSIAAAMLAFALALLCKEQAAGILPVAGLLAWWKRGTPFVAAARQCIPLAAVLLGYYLLRCWVFASPMAGLNGAVVDFGLSPMRALGYRFEILGAFLASAFWPADLAFFRGVRPAIPPGDSVHTLHVALGAIWVAALPILCWLGKKRTAFWAALPLVWLAPQVIFYESAGAFPQSDRYLYFPMFGFALWFLYAIRNLTSPKVAFGAACAAAIPLLLLSQNELPEYKNNVAFFRAAIEDSPEGPTAYWSLGRELMAEYQLDQDVDKLYEAMVCYMTVLTLNRDYGDEAAQLGPGDPLNERFRELEHLVHRSEKRPPLGEYGFVSTEDLFQANMGQGWFFLELGKLPPHFDSTDALDVFTHITQAFPNRHEGWIGLGQALLASKRPEEARSATAKATQINPNSAVAWSYLGDIQIALGQLREATGSFKEAQQLRPFGNQDRIKRIKVLLDMGQLPVVEDELRILKEEDPNHPEVLYLEAMLAANRGQWEFALNAWDRLLADEPENADAHFQRGKILTHLKRSTDAIAAFGRACELDSTHFGAHALIGQLLVDDPNTHDQARSYLERAYRLGKPGVDRSRVQLLIAGWIAGEDDVLMQYMHLDEGRGDFEAALVWIEVLQSKPGRWANKPDRTARMATVQLTAGNCLRSIGQNERAVVAYQQGIELNDGEFWLHYQLGTLLRNLSRFDEAIPELESALNLIGQVPEKDNLRGAVRTDVVGQIQSAKALGPDLMGPPVAPTDNGQSD